MAADAARLGVSLSQYLAAAGLVRLAINEGASLDAKGIGARNALYETAEQILADQAP